MDINKYLSGNKVSEIRVGQSGANVYEINGEQIIKHVQRNMLKNDMFDTYKKEALFYQSKMNTSSEYLPEILSVELSDDEIIILMKKYAPLERSNSDGELQKVINPELIKKHIATSNVITTFEFWHAFLHGNPEDRVKGIFDKLINDFQMLESL